MSTAPFRLSPSRTSREKAEQEALFRWVRMNSERLPGIGSGFAIPNGAFLFGTPSQRAAQWARLKAGGARKGVSDTFFPGARRGFYGLWIEIKAPKPHDAQITTEQREWAAEMSAAGYLARFCYGWVSASELIEWYFGPETESA